MTAMTDGLGLLMEATICYKKLNNCCKSCNCHVVFLCVLTLTSFKHYETLYILPQYVCKIVSELQADVTYAATCRSVTSNRTWLCLASHQVCVFSY